MFFALSVLLFSPSELFSEEKQSKEKKRQIYIGFDCIRLYIYICVFSICQLYCKYPSVSHHMAADWRINYIGKIP